MSNKMFKLPINKIKRAWSLAHGSRCRSNTRSLTSRNHRPAISVLRRAEKSTKTGKEQDVKCHKCKQLIEFIFGPPSTINRPLRQPTIEQILQTEEHTTESQINYKPESNCEKCNRLLTKVFGTDDNSNPRGIPTTITKTPLLDVHALQSTTTKKTEEQLVQKIEIIEETPLVEAESQKLEGFNVTPRVLGHLAELNIIRTIEFIGNKDYDEMHLVNFATDMNSRHTGKSDGTDDLNPFEILAKRCVDVPSARIDDRKQKKQLNVSTTPNDKSRIIIESNSNRKTVKDTQAAAKFETRRIDNEPTLPSSDKFDHTKSQKHINTDQKKNTEPHPMEQSQAALYSRSNFRKHTSTTQITCTYPTVEEISQGLPDPQHFYTGFKPTHPTAGEQSTGNRRLDRPPEDVSPGFIQQQYFYSHSSYCTYPPTAQFSQGFYPPRGTQGYPEGYWEAPTEQNAGRNTPIQNAPEISSNQKTIQTDQKTPTRAIEGRPNISLFQETFVAVPHRIEETSQSLLRPEYISPIQPTDYKINSTNTSKRNIAQRSRQDEHFSSVLPREQDPRKEQHHKYFPKKEIVHGLVLQESFCSSPSNDLNTQCFSPVNTVSQVWSEPEMITPDQKTPIRAVEAKPDIGTTLTSFCLVQYSSSHLQPKHEKVQLPKKLQSGQERCQTQSSRTQKKVDPVKGKCGKGKPKCPPPPPQCPPPDPCPPRPCPPRQPPCPKPCKPACPPPCTPPAPSCDPKNNPCKFKRIYLSEQLQNVLLQLVFFGSKKLRSRTYSLPVIYYRMQAVDFCTKAILTRGLEIPLENLGCNLIYDPDLGKCNSKSETVISAKTFDPWVPIPSSPIPIKVEKKPFVCPKEGCKDNPPPRLDAPCGSPCKGGDPCTTFPKRRN